MEDWDEEAPRLAADDSGFSRPLTLAEGPHVSQPGLANTQWNPDGYNFSTALQFDGAAGTATTAAPVLRTEQSYSVSAWVRLDAKVHQTVLRQDGTNRSAFFVMYNGPSDQWVVTVPTHDDPPGPGWQAAYSTSVPQVGVWAHLTAVYDAASRQLLLYVNGQLQGTKTGVVSWASGSMLRVGSAKSGYFLNGAVDRVRVWQGVLSAAQVSALAAEP